MEHVTSADGTRIAFTRSGRGTPLLLVHGAAGAGSRWAGISPALESAFTVHAMDRRGRGSSGDGERYSLAREADDVVAVLDAIGNDAIVLGHSFGGLVTLEAVRQRPGIRGVILYEPPIRTAEPLFPTSLISDLEAVLASEGPESLVEQFMISVAGVTPVQLAMMRKAPSWSQRVAGAHTLTRELRASERYEFAPARFRALTAPVCLLAGSKSISFAQSATDTLAGALPNATPLVLAGQAHTAMDTDPEGFVAAVKAFALRTQVSRAA